MSEPRTDAAERPMFVWHVEWWDSAIIESGWMDRKDVLRDAERGYQIQHTVGWLVHETDDYIVLALTHQPVPERLQGTILVPRSAVRSITVWTGGLAP